MLINMSLLSAQSRYQSLAIIDDLIQDGQPIFGVFAQVRHINYLDYYSHLISQKPISNWRKNLKANQFCFIQVIQPPYRICFALATIKLATTAFVYIYNQETAQLEICEALQPLTHSASFTGDHYQGQMTFTHPKLALTLNFNPSQIMVELDSKILALKATLERQVQPLAVCTPAGRRGWTFTQKEPLKSVLGHLLIKPSSQFNTQPQAITIDFTESTMANLDWTLGYMRHETNWFWTCINSYLPDGRHFLLNLSMGVNETGMGENACWLDGNIFYLPAVLFSRDKIDSEHRQQQSRVNSQGDAESQESNEGIASSSADLANLSDAKPWRIYHQNLGWSNVDIDLTFTPITVYKKTDNFGMIASIFEQWLGEYSGEIRIGEQVIRLEKIVGLAEDHFAKW